ncbi:MAG: DNA polymerase II large subunit [Methanobacteriota archaeon]
MGSGDASLAIRSYFEGIESELDRAYAAARAARSRGFDPAPDVEVKRTRDMADRVERLLEVEGVAREIRELAGKMNREELSIEIAKRTARMGGFEVEDALEKSVRVGLAILTEGILVAPIEGIAKVRIRHESDGSNYVAVYFAGPIRSAGGTGQAMSVLLADIVRRELRIGAYKATQSEIERWKEEIPLYKQAQHLQYSPTNDEIDLIIGNCPICIDGEGTEDVEISGFRDLPRIETNRVRGGACLIIAEGLSQKAAKIQKHVKKLKIDGWEFIDHLLKKKGGTDSESSEYKPSWKYMKDLVAGRPVLSHPSAVGGFRLRYGKSRTNGLAGLSMHPALMPLLGDILAIGTQIKIERPGKAGIVTPCDELEPPIVLLKNGSLVEVATVEDAKRLYSQVDKILDIGEILVPFGEFLENNQPLAAGAFDVNWYEALWVAGGGKVPANIGDPTFEEALAWSKERSLPLHPNFNLFWHDLRSEDIVKLSELVEKTGIFEGRSLKVSRTAETKALLEALCVLHEVRGNEIIVGRHSAALAYCLGLDVTKDGKLRRRAQAKVGKDGLATVSALAGIAVKARGPTRIGARMARPEKAKEREMKVLVHALFPVGEAGGSQRLFSEASKAMRPVDVELEERGCKGCHTITPLKACPNCGAQTRSTGQMRKMPLDIRAMFEPAAKSMEMPQGTKVKGVKGMLSESKIPEPIEKGILRAKHGLSVFKDGTIRFDITDAPLTHFKPREIGLTVERARELGYDTDCLGRPLESAEQAVELRPQDVIISESGVEYLLRIAQFLDELLVRFYNVEPYYNVKRPEDMIGQALLGLSPHTSGGVCCRLIGHTGASVCYAHPYFHAAKRRNCDGDEDCVMLLMDALLNFSFAYLPVSRGGRMDAPMILSSRIDPAEIDKEALNIDAVSSYPAEFYAMAEARRPPKDAERLIDNAGKRLGSLLQYEGLMFTHDTHDIAAGTMVSAYKTIEDMNGKMELQMSLAKKLAAVDENDVAERLINAHLLPDMIGNLKKFTTQGFRCTSCGAKFRRMPVTGKCKCKNGVILTVHPGSVTKYLEKTKRLSTDYEVNNYTRQRIALIELSMASLFHDDRGKTLMDFGKPLEPKEGPEIPVVGLEEVE